MDNPVVPCVKPLHQEKQDGMLVTWNDGAFSDALRLRTSLPCDTQEDRIGLYAISESDCQPAREVVNTELVISDYICHECELHGRDGEVVRAVRTILLQPNGRPVAFVSKAALNFVRRTARHELGQPAWDPPIKVKLALIPIAQGQTYKFHIDRTSRKKK